MSYSRTVGLPSLKSNLLSFDFPGDACDPFLTPYLEKGLSLVLHSPEVQCILFKNPPFTLLSVETYVDLAGIMEPP